MRYPFIALIALFAAGLALSAAAETPSAPPPPPASPTEPVADPEKAKKDAYDSEVICRSEDETGSRLRKTKICMTRKEWRNDAQDASDAVSKIQRNNATSGIPGQ